MNYVVRGALRVERPRRLRNGRQPADGIESEAFRRPLLDGHVLGGLHFLLCKFYGAFCRFSAAIFVALSLPQPAPYRDIFSSP